MKKNGETLIHAVRIFSQDIGMEFGIEKCAMLVMKSGKRHLTDGMELPNQDTPAEDETWYLGILEAEIIKQVEMKDKIQKEHLRRTRKLLETKLSNRNLIKGINTWAVPLFRYTGPFLKWSKEQCIRHYIPETTLTDYTFQEEREKENFPALKTVLSHRYNDSKTIYKNDGGLITAIRNDTDNTMDSRMTITRKQKWEGKQLYGSFKRLINNISHDKTWTWLRKGNFKRETESLLIAAQNNAVRTNHIKARIDKTQ